MDLIEWPERATQTTAAADIKVELAYGGEGRAATLSGLSERVTAVLASLKLPP